MRRGRSWWSWRSWWSKGQDHGMLEGVGRGREVVAVHVGAGGVATAGRTVSGVRRWELCAVTAKRALWCWARRHRHWREWSLQLGARMGDLSERKSWELDRWRRHVQTGRLWLPALSISNFPFGLLMKGKH